MLKRIIALLLAIGSLLLGLQVYIHSRANDLFIHEVLRTMDLLGPANTNDSVFAKLNLPEWLLHSLPDGLWMFALSLAILLIWNFTINRNSIIWLSIALFVGLVLEFFQGVGLIPGTFDWMDIVFVICGAFLPILGCKRKALTY